MVFSSSLVPKIVVTPFNKLYLYMLILESGFSFNNPGPGAIARSVAMSVCPEPHLFRELRLLYVRPESYFVHMGYYFMNSGSFFLY